MKSLLKSLVLCLVLLNGALAKAEVPQMMSFQGRFSANGTNFDGVAQFRFALVDKGTVFYRPFPQQPIILYNTYWSHDGSSSGGSAPTSSVPVIVTRGLYTILLGDTTISNMTQSLPPSVFTNSEVFLRVWVDDGTSVQRLSPDQRITATAYALKAANVDLGAITTEMIADGAVTGSKVQEGSIKTSQLDDGGSGSFQSLQETAQTLGADASLAFADLVPIPSSSGTSVRLRFSLNGSPFGTVLGFSGSEGISKPYSYMVQVEASGTLNPAEPIGNPAVLTFSRDTRTTTFGGIVTACTLGGTTGSGRLYNFRIESPLANLALKTDYAINQAESVPTVASRIYQNDAGTPPVNSLQASYSPATILVQYGETDLNFFSRLLENEGISYFFNQSATPPTLTLVDAPTAFPTAPNGPFPYYGDTATNIDRPEFIRTFQSAVHQSTLRATVNNYNFDMPRSSLQGTLSGANGVGETYEFGGPGDATKAMNEQLARVRLERHEVERALISGSGTVPDLRAGYKFALRDSSAAAIEGTFLVVAVRHAAFVRVTNGVSTCFYGNRFEAIPATLPYRPALATPKPKAQSCTAVVTGPAGEEIHVDKYGRIKLQFHWDRYGVKDDHSSAWVRVASPWAGNRWGVMFLPRVGQEVLVDFIQGNPDQPVVVGSLYNADHMPPYTLPTDKTKSTIMSQSSKGGAGFNELRFDDNKGSEEVLIRAEKDLNIYVKNNTTFNASNDFAMKVSHDFTLHNSHDLTVNIAGIGTLTAPVFQLSASTGVGINLNGTTPQSALDVNGTVRATAFQGDGSGLTGTVSDSRLTGNVALRNANQTFTGQNTFTGPVALNSVQSSFTLNQNDILLKSDDKHGLGYYGGSKLFGVLGVDGPVLYGYSGGALGTKTFDTNLVSLMWNNSGNVTIGATNTPAARLDVYGTTIIRSNLVVYGSISNVGAFYTSGGLLASSLSVNITQASSIPANTWTKVGDIGIFTKQMAGSILELTLNSRLCIGSWGSGATGADFELRVDNAPVTTGRARATVVPADNLMYGISASITGIFNNLSAGNHTVSVWVYSYGGTASVPTVNPGNFSAAHLVIKEYK